jgi:hypothetical protein
MLEDLVAAAANDAASKARALHMEAMQGLTGGMELPGLEDALAKLTGMAGTNAESDRDDGPENPLTTDDDKDDDAERRQ